MTPVPTSPSVELSLQVTTPEPIPDDSAQTWQAWIQAWISTVQDSLPPAPAYELTLRLTDDAEIRTLNHQFRQLDRPTDVLAFAALETDLPDYNSLGIEALEAEPLYLGDVIISVTTATRQAEVYGHSLTTELAWLAAHGFLHLLGWDHPDEESLQAMWAEQAQLLQQIGVPIPCLT
ncbi:rRNA maturation RNase YbeY [Synechocystis sp. LKSZ1]|uniref:rRNA maturation RNase YbeY n=1 Tax=Synechocystis sp. LKSZ1 TaxID=3144951 RepID=UPI00336BBC61